MKLTQRPVETAHRLPARLLSRHQECRLRLLVKRQLLERELHLLLASGNCTRS